MSSRRVFVRAGVRAAMLLAGARTVRAQGPSASASRALPDSSAPSHLDTTNLFVMDQGAAIPLHLPPKRGARPVVTAEQRDALERRFRCPCGCTHDIYTCRRTDLDCAVAPQLHADIMALVNGGHDEDEIEGALLSAYGEGLRMVPRAEGFDLLGWVAPVAAIVISLALSLRVLLRARRPGADA
jgi:cytochrome c-type biogenesis protein CcmH/NrfF